MPSLQHARPLSAAQMERSAAWVRSGLVLAAAVLTLAMGWVLRDTLRHADNLARAREEQLAANGLRVRQHSMEDTITTETVWDDAVANMDLAWSETWARANMVQWLSPNFQVIRVYAAGDRPVLHYARDLGPRDEAQLQAVAADLLPRVRNRERERGVFSPRSKPSPTVVSKAIQESTTAVVGGRLYLFTASLVQPDFGTKLPHARAPVVLVGLEGDGVFLRAMSDGLLLNDLAFRPRGARPEPARARIPVPDAHGRIQGFLSWRPHRPAAELARSLAWPAAGCCVLLALAALLVGVSESRYRRRLEFERRRAELASDAKSRFLANMSHEIRTPLNGVMGMAQLLDRGELTTAQRDLLGVILRSGKMLTAVLNDVLDISKIEAGQLQLDPREFDLAECVETACRPFAGVAHEKDIGFEIEIAPEARGWWLGDDARLRQILSNLCANAVKFTAEGAVRVQAERCDDRLQVRVTDSGIGIPADRLGSLFKEFSQADASTTRTYGGTGLGLAICRRLAELMGGALTVESRPGEGSTFCVDVPIPHLRSEPLSPQPAEPASSSAPAAIRVLAADDNEINRRILQALLAPTGSQVVLASDGEEAVEAFKTGGFDLVLMDVQMPKKDGVAATREIRAFEAAKGRPRTPILALTANVLVEQLREYMDAGMDGHIGKPIDFNLFVEAVNRVLGPAPAVPELVRVA